MKKVLLLILVLAAINNSYSQVTMDGGKGILRIWEAETVRRGTVYINPFYLGYGQTVKQQGWAEDHTMNVGLTFSPFSNVEMLMQVIPYQDDQKSAWGPVGDIKIGLKASRPVLAAGLSAGLAGVVRFPTAMYHNVGYEPYSNDKTGWLLLFLSTYDFMKSLAKPVKVSANIGYMDQYWRDGLFSGIEDQVVGGIGVKALFGTLLFYTELSGEVFINNENVSITQNSLRVSPGIRFPGPWKFTMDIAGDFELGGYEPGDAEVKSNPFLKDYADWKVIVGATFAVNVFTPLTPEQKVQRAKQEEEAKKLEQIREQREKAVKEMEEMKKEVEKK